MLTNCHLEHSEDTTCFMFHCFISLCFETMKHGTKRVSIVISNNIYSIRERVGGVVWVERVVCVRWDRWVKCFWRGCW